MSKKKYAGLISSDGAEISCNGYKRQSVDFTEPIACHFCGRTITGAVVVLDFPDKSVLCCEGCSRLKHDITKPIGRVDSGE